MLTPSGAGTLQRRTVRVHGPVRGCELSLRLRDAWVYDGSAGRRPGLSRVGSVSLFQGTAGSYRQFRSGVPAEVAAILTAAAPDRRPRVLDRLASIVAPDGVVAVFGDNSIWADNAGWKSEIKAVLAEFLGADRRAGSGTYQRPAPYTDDLDASEFCDWEQLTVPVRRERSLDSVIGYLHSTSFAAPHLFGDRLGEFDEALRERLPQHSENGMFIDHNEFGILIARRPS